jgi:hypothetical protein
MLTQVSLVVEVDSDYSTVAEVGLPHAKRFSALVGVLIAPHPDFK